MIDQPRTQKEFRNLVERCIRLAEQKYRLDFGRVTISFDLRGKKAAEAIQDPHVSLGSVYKLRFNKDAIQLDWDHMANSTIPHEVAHLVAFADPSLKADNHNIRWRNIAIALGDVSQGETYHHIDLPSARRSRKFVYENRQGVVVAVSAKLHRRVQSGEADIYDGYHSYFSAKDFKGLQGVDEIIPVL